MRPETQSPGQGFFGMIAGFDEVAAGDAQELSGIEVVDPHTIRFTLSRPDATFLHVMALNFSLRRAQGGGRGVRPGFRQQPGRHRRLSHDRLDARPARGVRAQSRLLPRGPAQARPDHLRGRPGAAGGPAPAAARRGRHAGRSDPAGQVSRGHGRPRMERGRGRGRPAAYRLRHDERQDPAVRQPAGAPGGQSRRSTRSGSSGSSTAARCRPTSRCRRRCRATTRTTRAMPTIRRRPRRCSPRPASPTASTPSCSP